MNSQHKKLKVTHRGLAKPDDPVYKQGWSIYIGPRQIEPPKKPTKPKPTRSTPKFYIQ